MALLAEVGETDKPVPTATFVTVPVLDVFAFHAFILASVTKRCVLSCIFVCTSDTDSIPPAEASVPNIDVK